MLRITVHEDGILCRLELAGRLGGPWVAETEGAWRSSLLPGKQVEIDMRELTGVDDSGLELLSAMYEAGARLVTEGVWMAALVKEITSRPSDGATRSQRKNFPGDRRSANRRNAK